MINDDDGDDGDGVKGPVRRKLSCRPDDSGKDLFLALALEDVGSVALTHGIPSIVEGFLVTGFQRMLCWWSSVSSSLCGAM
jgi:hypothetical protein